MKTTYSQDKWIRICISTSPKINIVHKVWEVLPQNTVFWGALSAVQTVMPLCVRRVMAFLLWDKLRFPKTGERERKDSDFFILMSCLLQHLAFKFVLYPKRRNPDKCSYGNLFLESLSLLFIGCLLTLVWNIHMDGGIDSSAPSVMHHCLDSPIFSIFVECVPWLRPCVGC